MLVRDGCDPPCSLRFYSGLLPVNGTAPRQSENTKLHIYKGLRKNGPLAFRIDFRI